MSENDQALKSGSQVFEKYLGTRGPTGDSFEMSESRPPRISFERADGESLSAAYGRISLVRHYRHDLFISLGEHAIHLEGDLLKPLYDALHREEVIRVIEQPMSPHDDFFTAGADVPTAGTVTVVRKIHWPDELSLEG